MTDLTVIGGGAAGCRAAALAAKEGFSVALIEGGALGGCAFHEGFWPYRRLLDDVSFIDRARSGGLGVTAGGERYAEMLERMRAFTESMTGRTRENLTSLGVDIICSAARVNGLNNNRYSVSAGERVCESRRLLLCMGSLPVIPDLPGVEKARRDGFMLTPGELLSARPPGKAVISGGAMHDLRMAAWLAACGVSVVLLSPCGRAAAELDDDISVWLSRNMDGVQFVTDAALASIDAGRVTVSERGGGRVIECDMTVIGGRRFPATRGLGLSEAAIATDNGAVITDMTGRANLPDVYAAGDVNMRTQTALGAMREAEVCVANMLGRHESVPYHAMPSVFSGPVHAAAAGQTEAAAKSMGYRVLTSIGSVCAGKGGRDEGMVKLIADENTGRLLGAHLCGRADGADVIWELAAVIEAGCDAFEARRAVTPRSAFAEAAQRALQKI
ncbi:MAG: FAD-dependent oxidoreductase [Oscillospiraceae bacterium]|nr:FAD-dependent oxidoreductase [Oscillospiraceae bacterium]